MDCRPGEGERKKRGGKGGPPTLSTLLYFHPLRRLRGESLGRRREGKKKKGGEKRTANPLFFLLSMLLTSVQPKKNAN